jgi:hypothetical protein
MPLSGDRPACSDPIMTQQKEFGSVIFETFLFFTAAPRSESDAVFYRSTFRGLSG